MLVNRFAPSCQFVVFALKLARDIFEQNHSLALRGVQISLKGISCISDLLFKADVTYICSGHLIFSWCDLMISLYRQKRLNAQSLLSKGGCLLKEIKNVYNRGRGGIFMRLSFSYRWAYSTWFHALLISGVNGGGVTWKHSENLSTPLCFIEVSWTATYSILTLRQELYFFQLVEQLEKHEGMGHPHQWYNENPPYYISLQYGGSYLGSAPQPRQDKQQKHKAKQSESGPQG